MPKSTDPVHSSKFSHDGLFVVDTLQEQSVGRRGRASDAPVFGGDQLFDPALFPPPTADLRGLRRGQTRDPGFAKPSIPNPASDPAVCPPSRQSRIPRLTLQYALLEFFTGWIDVNKHEVNFKWASVNETLGDEYFSMETVDLPSGTPIYDWRDGELMLLIGYVGDRRGSIPAVTTLVFTIVVGLGVLSFGFLLWRRPVSKTK